MKESLETLTALFQLGDIFKKAGLEKRQRFADRFTHISELLEKAAKELKDKNNPIKEFEELHVLAEKLPDFLGSEMNEDEVKKISQRLRGIIGDDPKIALDTLRKDTENQETKIQEIEGCAGYFKGLASRALAIVAKPKSLSTTKGLLLFAGVVGLVGVGSWFAFPDTAKNISRRFASQDSCLALLQEGRTLRWRTIDRNGKIINRGTLVITYANVEVGNWTGEHITSRQDGDDKLIVDGTFDSSSMVMDNPAYQGERWRGDCNSGKIEGSIEMFGYQDQPRFEMY